MRVAVFSTKPYVKKYLEQANEGLGLGLHYFETRLTPETAPLAQGFEVVCAFVNDKLDAQVLRTVAKGGTELIALRSAGFNHVDIPVAESLGLTVVRVPAYSPYAVAEHALGLILSLNRNIHRAHNRVREGNFDIVGLLGFDLHGKTVGVIGSGKIGFIFARIMKGLGCRVLAYDPFPNTQMSEVATYVTLPQLFAASDIISLHCPLTPETHHIIGNDSLEQMKQGVMIINTSRGALVDTVAVIEALKDGKIGHLGLDVYEEEADLFFEDLSDKVIQDDVFSRLLTFPNVLITGHQAFFTEEAIINISQTTLQNIANYAHGSGEIHKVSSKLLS